MSTARVKSRIPRFGRPAIVVAVIVAATFGAGTAQGATAPVKELLAARFGRQVDQTQTEAQAGSLLEDICTVESGDTCKAALESSIAGGYMFPQGVAVGPDGNLYVADTVNNRVQVLTSDGLFVRMFGWDVDKTKDEQPSATQAERNLCTAASGDTCTAGVAGGLAGQMYGDNSIAVDPSGYVYVIDRQTWRVDKFTAEGSFVLTIGGEVNKTKTEESAPEAQRNVCTAVSGDVCQAGVRKASTSNAPATFSFESTGDLLAIGGPQDLLYVGDEGRVQEFDPADGEWKGEIPLSSVSPKRIYTEALALDDTCALHQPPLTASTNPTCEEFDPEYGSLYLAYRQEDSPYSEQVLHKFASDGAEVKDGHFPLALTPTPPRESIVILGLAVDPVGRVALGVIESATASGSLRSGRTGRAITGFEIPTGTPTGLAFGRDDRLFGAIGNGSEIVAYRPVPVAELLTSASRCAAGVERESDATFDCTLGGEVDPWGVRETEAWFEWGATSGLGSRTNRQSIASRLAEGEEEPLTQVVSALEGLRPNQTFYYRLAGEDRNVKLPESLNSETTMLRTESVAPRIVGEPSSPFVHASSVVLHGELNPENALTRYEFQYGPCETLEACPTRESRVVDESSVYAKIGASTEITGLQPATAYRYRLIATNRYGQQTVGPEASFTTTPNVTVRAITGSASLIQATSALVSGSVDPDGQPADYSFELGLYNGETTRYGIVSSGLVAGMGFVEESLALTGLQPGTTYAYRIRISSPGYGVAYGAPATFTTLGQPAVLSLPALVPQLALPAIAFPRTSTQLIPRRRAGATNRKLASALRACRRKPARRRARCVREAHKRYGPRRARR